MPRYSSLMQALLCMCIFLLLECCFAVARAEDSSDPVAWLEQNRAGLEQLAQQKRVAQERPELLDKYFASARIGSHLMGRTLWQELSAEQQQQFLHRFGLLLELALGEKVEEYKAMQFVQVEKRCKNTLAQVAYLSQGQAPEVRLVYTLYLVDGDWRIFDINIDGMSLLRSYMVQIRPIVKERGFAAVIGALDEKLAALRD